MYFAVDGTHRDFFRKHRWIEFEGLLSSPRLATLEKEIEAVLSQRLKMDEKEKTVLSDYAAFMAGRDLWRGSQPIKKQLVNKNFAEIASEIIEHKPLRMGYDQLLPVAEGGLKGDNAYTKFLQKTPTLQEISPIQGVLCGLILCLKSAASNGQSSTLFTPTAGNGVVFAPDFPIPFHELKARAGCVYLLIVYVDAKAVYTHLEGVPHASDFKKIGYNLGDRLTDRLNPLVYL
jgi:hypothetical protein